MNKNNAQIDIPEDIMQAIKTASVYVKLEEIGAKYNLMLDQIGQLEVNTRMVMIGNEKSDNFVDTIAKNLEIPRETAQKIATDINNEIFMPVRESIRKMQEGEIAKEEKVPSMPPMPPKPPVNTINQPMTPPRPTPPPIQSIPISPKPPIVQKPVEPPLPPKNVNLSDIERVGGFTIENRPLSNSPQYNDTTPNREEMLREIEKYENTGSKEGINFVDHLLSNPVSNPEQIKVIKPENKKSTYTTDPYREPI